MKQSALCSLSDMTKLIAIAIVSIILLDIIKQLKGEYTSILTVGIGIVMLGILLPEAKKLYLSVTDIRNTIMLPDRLFYDLIKICLAGYICKLTCDLCEDNGYKSVSDKIELGCRIYVSGITITWIYRLIVDINKLL